MPGQPDPVYPPGQFSAWNRPSTRAAWLGLAPPAALAADADAEPGYSALAVSDASADATTTQTWAAIDDNQLAQAWAGPRTDRDWRSHADDAHQSPQWRPGTRPPGGDVGGRAAAAGSAAGGRLAREDSRPSPAPPGAPAPRAAARAVAGRAAAGRAAAVTTGRAIRQGRASGSRRPGKRHTAMMAALLLSPVVVVALVVGTYVYVSTRHQAPPAPATAVHPSPAPSTPTPALGPWKHIETRAQDPAPLTAAELFPVKFAAGGTAGTRTVVKSGTKCARAVIGSTLAAAVRKGGCTQVLRASYLSASRKLMATIGVLNLRSVATAERAGKASGASQFIRQLPAAHGPTHNLSKGTGLEEAEIKGHYLILIWAEFANLHKPAGHKQVTALKQFAGHLIAGTANISLTNRMVTGKPAGG